MEVTEPIILAVREPSQAGEARRLASDLARRLGFGETEAGKVAIIASEVATNLARHARGGELIVSPMEDGTARGVGVLAIDRGPGIADLARSRRDGYSTAGTPGTGLGAIERLSTLFDVHSGPAGTVVLSRLVVDSGERGKDAAVFAAGALCVPKPGEAVCGDAWRVVQRGARCVALVADGLGHGPDAAAAATLATRVFHEHAAATPAEIVESIHDALRGTRGAAAAVAEIDRDRRVVRFCGIGNVSAAVLSGTASRSMVSHHGTLGHDVRKIAEFEYPWPPDGLLVMHSDGLVSRWDLAVYPGLRERDPMLPAAVLYRDFARGRDDVCVLVVREAR